LDRDQTRSAPRTLDEASGVVLRATHRGALVLETANARRRTPALGGLRAMEERRESDQLPEEGPEEQVVEDEPGDAREEAEDTPGVPGEEERGTGQDE
jgi:hypothetical protein